MRSCIFEKLPSETREYQKQAIKAAKELRYGDEVIYKIEQAKTVGEIVRVMVTARKGEDNDVSSSKLDSRHR
jgi:hypothetical protein